MTDFSKIKKLYNIDAPYGFSKEEIDTIKDIFCSFPQVLYDYYAELGKYDFNQNQDSLNVPEDFPYFKNNDYLIFYCENQRSSVWGIRKEDLIKPNPPVYMSYDEKEWNIECESLSDFLYAMACLQAIFVLEYSSNCFYEIEKHELEFIRTNYADKGVSLKQWVTGAEFYGNYDDSVIVIMAGEQMTYSSGSKEHFEEMDKVLSKLGTIM